MPDLSIDETHAGPRPRNVDAGENFVPFQCSRKDVHEEWSCRHPSAAIRACDLDLRLQRHHYRRPVSRGIGVRERATYRAAVTYLGIGNEAGRLAKEWQLLV